MTENLSKEEVEAILERRKEIKRQKLESLSKMDRDLQENRIYHFNRPNPKQKELLAAWNMSEKKVFTFTGGNRTGKTTIGAILAISTALGFYPWSGQSISFPHSKARKIRYVGQDWEKHIMEVIIDALEEWWPACREVVKKKNNQGVPHLWTDVLTGSTIEIVSNKQDPKTMEGWHGDLVIYDEPPTRDIRVALARGLVDYVGKELFTMTLLNQEMWVEREVLKAMNEDGTPDMTVFNVHAKTEDNIGYGITQEGVDQFAKTLTPEEKQARLHGIPLYMSGIVYPQFNRNIHLKSPDKLQISLSWIVDIAIDFHPSKPWAVLFMATDMRGNKIVCHEIWRNGSWKSIGEEIIKFILDNKFRVANIVIDPLSKGDKQSDLSEHSVFDKLSDLFMAYGLPFNTATKDKEGGIHIIETLLLTENDVPAIFFLSSLQRTIYEIEGWSYDKEGKPEKKDDDMMENLYRLGLLDTEWVDFDDDDEGDHFNRRDSNPLTGY